MPPRPMKSMIRKRPAMVFPISGSALDGFTHTSFPVGATSGLRRIRLPGDAFYHILEDIPRVAKDGARAIEF
jgi:hypothetical protein